MFLNTAQLWAQYYPNDIEDGTTGANDPSMAQQAPEIFLLWENTNLRPKLS